MKIVFPYYKAISWNKLYGASHWATKKKMVDEAHQHVMVALAGMEYEMIDYPVDILTIAHLVRKIDADNVCDKILIDGLKGHILKDDSRKYVHKVSTVCYKSDHDFTEMIITKSLDK